MPKTKRKKTLKNENGNFVFELQFAFGLLFTELEVDNCINYISRHIDIIYLLFELLHPFLLLQVHMESMCLHLLCVIFILFPQMKKSLNLRHVEEVFMI